MKISGGGYKIANVDSVYVSMPINILQELMAYVKHYETEVSGFGLVSTVTHRGDDGKIATEFKIEEVILPQEQDNTGGGTKFTEEIVAKKMTELFRLGKDISKIRLHWHSHCSFSVFHSGIDQDNYDELQTGEYLISLVLNHKGEILASVHIYKPLRLDITDVNLYIDTGDLLGADKARVDENIKGLDDYTAKHKSWFTGMGFGSFRSERETIYRYDDDNISIEKGYQHTKEHPSKYEFKIGKSLGMTKSDVKRIVSCNKDQCMECVDIQICNNFMIARYQGGTNG